MMPASTGPRGPVFALALVGGMVVAAPLYRGGNRPLALLALEAAALLLLAYLAWIGYGREARSALPRTAWWGLAVLLVWPLAQLVPLPAAWWAELPGHAPYAKLLELAGAPREPRALSLNPLATQYSWLALLPGVAVALAALTLGRRQLIVLARVFVAVAAGQALLGILQLGAAPGSPLYLGNTQAGGAAVGTYVNRNHFAGLLAMALPVALALWAAETLPPRGAGGEPLREHPRHADRRLAMRILLAMPLLLIGLALVFSLSRAGIGSGLAAFALGALAMVGRTGSPAARLALAALAVAALGAAAWIGLTPVIERFAPSRLAAGFEGREAIAAAAWRAGLDFLPFGSGLGTFADAFRRFQPESLAGFVDHAHNDYAELFVEMGIAGVAVAALFGAAWLAGWARLARGRRSRKLDLIQTGAGLGMLAALVHAFFDFNFHIPANALYFGLLAGLFFARGDGLTRDADRA